jgi:ATP-binding cassette, subfamily C (CFTR/MRP), member 1
MCYEQFAQVTTNIIEALVSINRLSEFLKADELQPDARQIVTSKKRLEVGDDVWSVRSMIDY